jgi:predicted RNA binding protein YcfA (HicA-like mRNA interferase family)
MSRKLPSHVSSREAIAIFKKIGFRVVRTKGSHVRLRDEATPDHGALTVPKPESLKPGLLRKLIRGASLDVDEFLRL